MKCDNVNEAHNLKIINETPDGVRVICKICKEINIIRFDANGRCDNREYSKIFKRDLLQPGENLWYKYKPQGMSIV